MMPHGSVVKGVNSMLPGDGLRGHSDGLTHFSGHLLMNRVADLTGHVDTFLDGDLDGHLLGDVDTFCHSSVNTVGLGDLGVDGGAFSDRFRVADGLGHTPADSGALLTRNLHTRRNGHTRGDRNLSGNLDRDLAALSLSDGLTGRGGSGGNNLARCQRVNEVTVSEELSVSFSICLGLSVSLSLHEPLGNNSGSTNNTGVTEMLGSRGNKLRSSCNKLWSSGNELGSRGNKLGSSSNMSNNGAVRLERNLGLCAGLLNDVLTLLGVGCVHHGVGLSGALLLGGALVFIDSGALLLWDLLDDVVALGDGRGGALLLRDVPESGCALRDGPGCTLLLVLSHVVSD